MSLGHYLAGLRSHIEGFDSPSVTVTVGEEPTPTAATTTATHATVDRTRDYLYDLANVLEVIQDLAGEPGTVPRAVVLEVVLDALEIDGAP